MPVPNLDILGPLTSWMLSEIYGNLMPFVCKDHVRYMCTPWQTLAARCARYVLAVAGLWLAPGSSMAVQWQTLMTAQWQFMAVLWQSYDGAMTNLWQW